jgi:hypothetical protein
MPIPTRVLQNAVDEYPQFRSYLRAARIIEEEAFVRRQPVFEHAFQASGGKMLLYVEQHSVSQADAVQGRTQGERAVVGDEAASNLDVEPAAVLAEVPGQRVSLRADFTRIQS